VTIQPIIFD